MNSTDEFTLRQQIVSDPKSIHNTNQMTINNKTHEGSATLNEKLPPVPVPKRNGLPRIVPVLQDGNKVIVRCEISATQEKPFMGFPTSRRKMTIQAVDIHEIGTERSSVPAWRRLRRG